ncbi:hypothetical protein LCM02_09995 [Lutimonas saemankumensis]|uniref:hypothetical protein n=1 Tax=Lutimonas saemankumensis TaxID=483016 RepID=UPI001CD38E0F|nr:hypothetical protein [Lutimonas saemankumensis]MCA0932782.1 hypothetical protein [Lutimonas saemankumensis]
MKTNYLFPHRFKRIGLIFLIPFSLFGIYVVQQDLEPIFLDWTVPAIFYDEIMGNQLVFSMAENNVLNEIIGIILIISGIMVAFSKEKQEDEFISKLRLESLVWATYVNYSVLLVSMLFVFGISFLWVMILNMFTILLFFIIRFNWQLRKLNKIGEDEK